MSAPTTSDQVFKNVDNAVDNLMGDPTAQLRAAADMTQKMNSDIASKMNMNRAAVNLPNLSLVANPVQDGKGYSATARQAADTKLGLTA